MKNQWQVLQDQNVVSGKFRHRCFMLGLWSSGIKKGDEVITSPISFIATSNSISHIGAVPVFVDVDEDLNINRFNEKAITKKQKQLYQYTGQEEFVRWIK